MTTWSVLCWLLCSWLHTFPLPLENNVRKQDLRKKITQSYAPSWQNWVPVRKAVMPSVVPFNPSLEDLRLTSRALTFFPRVRSASRTPSGHFQRKNALKSDSSSSVLSVADENLSLADIFPRVRSASRTPSGHFQRKNALKSGSSSSVLSVADENLSLADIERMLSQKVEGKKDDLKAAFRAFDQEGSGTVTKGEFRRVIESFLVPLTQSQFEALLIKVPKRGNRTIPYMEFLQQHCKHVSAPIRIPSVSAISQSWVLGELQCRLKEKIGRNLKTITRAFCLFDYNRDGRIQQHEFRRVLESYCFPLSQPEFQRLWSHYSPNNSQTLSYKEFLERLGVDCEKYRKVAPDSAKLALNWDAVNQSRQRAKSRKTSWRSSPETGNTLDEIHAKFLKKMSVNLVLVERALQAFDITSSGVVSCDDLRAVVSSFLFPIDDSTFLSLLSRFGLNSDEPVEWKKFISLFREEEQILPDGKDTGSATPDLSSIKEVLPKLQQEILVIYPLLKKSFLVFDKKRSGLISRDDLRRILQCLTFSLTDEQFTGLIELVQVPRSGAIPYLHFLDFFKGKKLEEQARQLSSKTTGLPDICSQPSTTSSSWSAVERILKEKLSEQYNLLMASLNQADPAQSCTITPEVLKKLIQQYGLVLSDNHFDKLCKPFMDSGRVNYKQMLASLGISRSSRKIKSANTYLSPIERNAQSAYRLHAKNIKEQAVVDVILRTLRDRLQMRGLTLQQCLMGTSRGSEGVLGLTDLQKILDDCNVFMQVPQFQTFIQALGFCDGQISFANFVAKYEAAITKQSNEEQKRKSNNLKFTFMSAEDCFRQLEKKIKECHGNVLNAFHLMDKNRDGLVNQNDFRVLFNSLRLIIMEKQYHRLLDMLGFKPGSTLNYTEFYNKVCSTGKTGSHLISNMTTDQFLDSAYEQVHAYLVATAHAGSSELSKAFRQYRKEGESMITKNDLKHILYKCYLPISPREFESIWARYDENGKGYLTHREFLDKMNITPQEFSRTESPVEETLQRAASISPLTETTLHNLREWLKLNFEDVSRSLVTLDKRKDGYTTIVDLLSLLQKNGFQIDEHQLLCLIDSLGLEVSHNKLLYLRFLDRLSGPVASPVSPSLGSPVPGESVEELSPERALQRLQDVVTSSSDTLSKAFKAFDTAGNGQIAQREFQRVLDHFCVRLSDVQYRRLLSKLSIRDGEEATVDWKKFLQTFDLYNQETSEEWVEKVHKARFPNQAHPLPISDILARIQEVVSARLYTITKEMVELDYARINVISKEDFRNICDHHFLRLTDDQFEKLWKMLPVNAFDNLDYQEFLKKFSAVPHEPETARKPSSPDSAGQSESSTTFAPRPPKTAPCTPEQSKRQSRRPFTVCERSEVTLLQDCEAVEQRLRSQLQACWNRIQRRCKEADAERSGELDKHTFLGILKDLHINLSESQLEHLCKKLIITSKGRLCYPEFLQRFVLFRPQSCMTISRPKLHMPRTVLSTGHLSSHCSDTLLRLRAPVQRYWKSMRRAFISQDKERVGKISLQDFVKVLKQHNINLSEEDLFHLASFFDENISGKISYNTFLQIFQT